MKKITQQNYREDAYYPRIVAAVKGLLVRDGFVRPVDVFVRMDLLRPDDLARWRAGRIPYLEQVIGCNLSKAGRILRVLRMHAHDLSLKPSATHYKHKGQTLRFSKSGDPNIEEAYGLHFVGAELRKRAEERRKGGVVSAQGNEQA